MSNAAKQEDQWFYTPADPGAGSGRAYAQYAICDMHIAYWESWVLIWCYGTTVGAKATYSGVKYEISGARASR